MFTDLAVGQSPLTEKLDEKGAGHIQDCCRLHSGAGGVIVQAQLSLRKEGG